MARDPLAFSQSSNPLNPRPLHDITPEEVLKVWEFVKYIEKLSYTKIRILTHEINQLEKQIKECKDEEKRKQLEGEKRKKEERIERIYEAINQEYLSYVRFLIQWEEERKKYGKSVYVEKKKRRIERKERFRYTLILNGCTYIMERYQ